ncbi:MAG: hypothetical protein WC356_07150 [Candidatus Micrarchaeia archaeon]|jgi:hypothetical protein
MENKFLKFGGEVSKEKIHLAGNLRNNSEFINYFNYMLNFGILKPSNDSAEIKFRELLINKKFIKELKRVKKILCAKSTFWTGEFGLMSPQLSIFYEVVHDNLYNSENQIPDSKKKFRSISNCILKREGVRVSLINAVKFKCFNLKKRWQNE